MQTPDRHDATEMLHRIISGTSSVQATANRSGVNSCLE
jgi:precorrin-6B methylase 1